MEKSPKQRLCLYCMLSGATFSMLLTNTVTNVIAARGPSVCSRKKSSVSSSSMSDCATETPFNSFISLFPFTRFPILRTTDDDHDDMSITHNFPRPFPWNSFCDQISICSLGAGLVQSTRHRINEKKKKEEQIYSCVVGGRYVSICSVGMRVIYVEPNAIRMDTNVGIFVSF